MPFDQGGDVLNAAGMCGILFFVCALHRFNNNYNEILLKHEPQVYTKLGALYRKSNQETNQQVCI